MVKTIEPNNKAQKIINKERESNIELFRIITMLLIVAHHYVVNSGLIAVDGPIFANVLSWRSMFLLLFGAWGKTGINCFVLITGYFMCTKSISLKKFTQLLLEIYLYRFVLYFVFVITKYNEFSLKSFVKLFFPFSQVASNFTGCYIIFFLCIPFLNILIKNMNEKQHLLLCGLLLLVYTLFGSALVFEVRFNYVTWFCVLYFIASYIRLYPKKFFDNTKLWGLVTLSVIAISIISIVVCTAVPIYLGKAPRPYVFLEETNKILAVCLSVCGFLFFKNIKIKKSRFINTVSATTFGVLLIHAHSDAMRNWLWVDVLNNVGNYNSQYLILHAVIAVIAVFSVCSFIDYLRICFLEKPFFKKWGNKLEKADEKIKNMISQK